MSRRDKLNRERCTKCGGETVWPKDLDVPRAPHVCPELTEQATAELDRLRTERAELLRQREESDAKLDEVLRNATPKLLAERERADRANDALSAVRRLHDNLIERLCALIPEDEMDDAAIEHVIVEWVRRQRERADKAVALARAFVAERDDYIRAIENCAPDSHADYHRWQGHAEARRQFGARLAELRTAAEETA